MFSFARLCKHTNKTQIKSFLHSGVQRETETKSFWDYPALAFGASGFAACLVAYYSCNMTNFNSHVEIGSGKYEVQSVLNGEKVYSIKVKSPHEFTYMFKEPTTSEVLLCSVVPGVIAGLVGRRASVRAFHKFLSGSSLSAASLRSAFSTFARSVVQVGIVSGTCYAAFLYQKFPPAEPKLSFPAQVGSFVSFSAFLSFAAICLSLLTFPVCVPIAYVTSIKVLLRYAQRNKIPLHRNINL
eukprot:Phypoly_transcript_16720.p1 GENE.Phypoly_transcript_16720~~Phypoly_transcript_16720.p1  ORF type:complete len:241 (+),score=3.21 Phypoly_transcript_16720:113-835(+)